MFSIMQQVKLPIFLACCYGRYEYDQLMTDACGPAYILPSRFRKDDRMLYATNIVESLPGIWGNWEMGGGGGGGDNG